MFASIFVINVPSLWLTHEQYALNTTRKSCHFASAPSKTSGLPSAIVSTVPAPVAKVPPTDAAPPACC
eukprot:3218551-Amphidinium_carterae.1